jgi:A/G-specific adenine glycosylase
MPAYTQGLMDLGALVCVRHAPRCAACPLAGSCRARREGRTAEWPARRATPVRPRRPTPLFILSDGQGVLLERRPPHGLWGGLLALPESLETLASLDRAALTPQALPPRTHLLTHLCLDIQPFLLRCTAPPRQLGTAAFVWLPLAEALRAGVPAPVARLLRELEAI